jgi:hypothetical protein
MAEMPEELAYPVLVFQKKGTPRAEKERSVSGISALVKPAFFVGYVVERSS